MLHSCDQMVANSTMYRCVNRRRSGFTIVELLIVIVVIGILAAITIVAFNGVSNRAKIALVISDAEGVVKTMESAKVLSGTEQYPASPTAANLKGSSGTGFQYAVNNSASPPTFCITVTNGAISYWVSNTNTKPTSGACLGQSEGGAQVTTNQFLNPQFVGPEAPVSATGTTASISTTQCGGNPMAYAVTSTSAATTMRLSSNLSRWSIAANQSVSLSVDVYNPNSSPRSFAASVRFYDSDGASLGTNLPAPSNASASVTVAPGTTETLTLTNVIAPAGTLSVGININRNTGTNSVSGDTYCADNVYLGEYPSRFVDGTTGGWIWNGTPNASTSTGPVRSL